jgi:uncharacterized protein YjbI with pentapeptide repeats
MPDQIEFIAHTDAELTALVHRMQMVCVQMPFRLLGLKFQAGVCLLRVESCDGLSLYHAVVQQQGAQTQNQAQILTQPRVETPAQDENEILLESNLSSMSTIPKADRLTRCFQQASVQGQAVTANSSADPNHSNPPNDSNSQNYQGQDLRSRCFARADLHGANFSDADLRGADFTGANLQNACLQRVRIGPSDEHSPATRLRHAAWLLVQGPGLAAVVVLLWLLCTALLVLSQSMLDGLGRWLLLFWLVAVLVPSLKLGLPTLRASLLKWLANGGTRFHAANLSGANFSGANIGLSNFHAAILNNNNWRGVVWQEAVYVDDQRLLLPKLRALLVQASRAEQDFSGMDLSGLDFSGLNLSGFDFHATDFSAANLQGADLTGADLSAWKIDADTCINQVHCDYWRAASLPGGRWPPAEQRMLAGEFAQRFMFFAPGIVFLAHGWVQLQVWLDAILFLQPRLSIRLHQIEIKHPTQAVAQQNEPEFLLEVQMECQNPQQNKAQSSSATRQEMVCREVWRQTQVQTQVQPILTNPPTEGERLFILLQALAGKADI